MLCAAPGNPYRIPATTRVSVGAIAADAPLAAAASLRALRDIEAGSGYEVGAGGRERGVIKVGFSWEARGVQANPSARKASHSEDSNFQDFWPKRCARKNYEKSDRKNRF